jgi:hypothetical protein
MCLVDNTNSASWKHQPKQQQQANQANTENSRPTTATNNALLQNPKQYIRRASSTVSETGVHLTCGSIVSGLVILFSISFPFWLAPYAASQTYHRAFYNYDAALSHFDNTAWTYATDYALGLVLAALISTIPLRTTVAFRSRALLACYMVSVLAGGLAHQFYSSFEDRNSNSFRALWSVCVGTVTLASAFMGPIGSELLYEHSHDRTRWIPRVPELIWWSYGACATAVCVAGGMSFQRPACDIFVAGITQFPSTVYMMVVLGFGLTEYSIPTWARVCGVLGFILNAPLLPLYPLLVQYTDWRLGTINMLLHTWLMTSWSMQGIALRRVQQALLKNPNDDGNYARKLPEPLLDRSRARNGKME